MKHGANGEEIKRKTSNCLATQENSKNASSSSDVAMAAKLSAKWSMGLDMFTERPLVPGLLGMITAKCSGRGRETDNLLHRNHVP